MASSSLSQLEDAITAYRAASIIFEPMGEHDRISHIDGEIAKLVSIMNHIRATK
jgi:hypothetical protein